ncbi:hypothetical protein [Ruminiclostridium josui]|uniref:hypothetical protein n=1 Tax=Ruminiclostridium josui TaxID=1499 RepID=UPI000465B6A8|nr:hypothetical protein [Ruminiclostridium josui]
MGKFQKYIDEAIADLKERYGKDVEYLVNETETSFVVITVEGFNKLKARQKSMLLGTRKVRR